MRFESKFKPGVLAAQGSAWRGVEIPAFRRNYQNISQLVTDPAHMHVHAFMPPAGAASTYDFDVLLASLGVGAIRRMAGMRVAAGGQYGAPPSCPSARLAPDDVPCWCSTISTLPRALATQREVLTAG